MTTIKQLTVPASPECVLFQCNYSADQIAFYGYYGKEYQDDTINHNIWLVAAWKCKQLHNKPKTTQNEPA